MAKRKWTPKEELEKFTPLEVTKKFTPKEDLPKTKPPRKTIEEVKPIKPLPIQRTPEEVTAGKAAGQAFIQEREARTAALGGGLKARRQAAAEVGELGLQRTVGEAQAEARAVEEALLPQEALSAQLEEDILTQPSIEPTALLDTSARRAEAERQIEFFGKLITGKASSGEIIDEAKRFATGLLIAGVVALGIYSAPYVAKMFVGAGTKKIMSEKLFSLGGATKAVIGYFGVRQVTDYRGGELDTMRKGVASMTEDGERIQALALQGLDVDVAFQVLTDMSEEIDAAEAAIKRIGNLNIQFRYEKQWIEDMRKIRSSRLAVSRRVTAVLNIARTGATTISPEALMYEMSQFEE